MSGEIRPEFGYEKEPQLKVTSSEDHRNLCEDQVWFIFPHRSF